MSIAIPMVRKTGRNMLFKEEMYMKAIEYAKAAVDTMMRKFDAEKLPPEGHFHYHQECFCRAYIRRT